MFDSYSFLVLLFNSVFVLESQTSSNTDQYFENFGIFKSRLHAKPVTVFISTTNSSLSGCNFYPSTFMIDETASDSLNYPVGISGCNEGHHILNITLSGANSDDYELFYPFGFVFSCPVWS